MFSHNLSKAAGLCFLFLATSTGGGEAKKNNETNWRYNAATNTLTIVQERIETVRGQLQTSAAIIQNYETMMTSAKLVSKAQASALAESQQKLDSTEESKKGLEEENANLKKRVRDLEDLVLNREKEKESISISLAEANETRDRAVKGQKATDRKLSSLDTKYKKLEGQLESTKLENTILNERLDSAEREKDSSREEIAKKPKISAEREAYLSKKLEERDKQIADLEELLIKKEKALAEWQSSMNLD
ncbi:hypothetical protein AGMMS50296_1230 [Alphaproteobacteria bacterium]|nr:hypothetical protein AGMMS50296_1230 [Alphaproteobacteria bacterium]